MRRVFADTSYWIAIFSPRDTLHELSVERSRELDECILVTSEMVLTEFLLIFSEGAENSFERELAASFKKYWTIRISK